MEWPFYVKYGKDLEKSSTIKNKCTTFITVQGIQNQQNIIQQCVITTFRLKSFWNIDIKYAQQLCPWIVHIVKIMVLTENEIGKGLEPYLVYLA